MRRSLCLRWANPLLVSTGPPIMGLRSFNAGPAISTFDIGGVSALRFHGAHFHPSLFTASCCQRAAHSCTGSGVRALTHCTNGREERGYYRTATRMHATHFTSSSVVVQKRSVSNGSIAGLSSRHNFKQIRDSNLLYVDKTEFIHQLIKDNAASNILFRPRRFGKTLFLNTLKCFFEGKKELFEGLKIAELMVGKKWEEYPVLLFKISDSCASDLKFKLVKQAEFYAKQYNLPKDEWSNDIEVMMLNLLRHILEEKKKPAVVLIDEFNHPRAEHLLLASQTGTKEEFNELKKEVGGCNDVLSQFLSFIKDDSCPKHYVFLTGITSYTATGVSTALNTSANITLDKKYRTICGFTEAEIDAYFADNVKRMKDVVSPGATYEEFRKTLKNRYNGYHFSSDLSPEAGVYNPFSFVKMLENAEIGDYWLKSGGTMPVLSAACAAPRDFFHFMTLSINVNTLYCQPLPGTMAPLSREQIVSVLYQQGYLTVKTWNTQDLVSFTFPNEEVRRAFCGNLLQQSTTFSNSVNDDCNRFIASMNKHDLLGMVHAMNSLFCYFTPRGVLSLLEREPVLDEELQEDQLEEENQKKPSTEYLFSEVLLIFFVFIKTFHEKFDYRFEHTVGSTRADFIISYGHSRYVLELKTNRVKAALENGIKQIKDKHYDYSSVSRRKHYVVLVFCRDERMICEAGGWERGGEKVCYNREQCITREHMEKIDEEEQKYGQQGKTEKEQK